MITASFWPFLIKSCVSIRLIKESGPVPTKIGRYIGRSVVFDDGTSVTCDDAKSAIDNRARNDKPKTRMGRYASELRRFFKGNLWRDYAASCTSSRATAILRTTLRRRK